MRRVLLKSLQANSGFLENVMVPFSKRLTCIIGARGTCKSTVVESVRFAFNSDPIRIAEITESGGMLSKTLGSGSIKCEVEVIEDGTSSQYVIDREIGSDPRVSRDGTRDPLAQDILHEIEIYSQGALQKIASSDLPELRLQLIDRPHRMEIVSIRRETEQLVSDLKSFGAQLRTIRFDLERKRAEIKELDQLRLELGRASENRPELPPTLEEQHAVFMRRQRLLELLNEVQMIQKRAMSDAAVVLRNRESVETLRAVCSSIPLPETAKALLILDQLGAQIEVAADMQQALALIPVAPFATELTTAFEKANEQYYQQRQQQQTVTEFLKREDAVRRRVAELEKIEREVTQLSRSNELLRGKREDARNRIAYLQNQVFEFRVAEADKINNEFGDVVLLTVRRGAHSKPYIDRVSELLSGSRTRSQEDIAREIATALPPAELLSVIEEGDAQRLANLLQRDLGQMNRVVTYLRDHPDLYELDGQLFEDSLEITMFDHGVPKAVEHLSEGQRATALLPLILREGTCPLIVDQPEDDLDNSFIFQVLVKNIARIKPLRQLVFVTHNANIPVLGDAEQVVVMHMKRPDKADSPRLGGLDERKGDILELLEGGKEAFERREERYRPLIK
jgi:ABC-type enterochelin transport system ATPase subunit